MKINDYLKKYYKCSEVIHNHNIDYVTSNSKNVKKNCIYVYIDSYSSTNQQYIFEAINKGAKTIFLSNKNKSLKNAISNKINLVYVENPKVDLARLLKIVYLNRYLKFPTMISVTGTYGKTTSSSIIYQTIKNIGYDVLLIGSNGNYGYYGNVETYYETKNTTPSIFVIYDLMSKNELAYDYVIIEVSSQGEIEGRILGIEFDYCLITSFSPEHLEYHQNLSEYKNAKARIINKTKHSIIINAQINDYDYFSNLNEVKKVTYGINKGDYKLLQIDGLDDIFIINDCSKSYLVQTKLKADFNMLNIVGAFALLKELNIDELKILNSINSIDPILGRMNLIYNKKKEIYVDYAHTISAVEAVLKYFCKIKKGRIITVIGCGGDRDKSRRPKIGKITTLYSDLVIFTEDNSRSENTKNIINDIISRVENNNYFVEEDRFKAIKLACDISKEDDIVLILGKGNEKQIIANDNLKEFNDIEVVKLLMKGK